MSLVAHEAHEAGLSFWQGIDRVVYVWGGINPGYFSLSLYFQSLGECGEA